MEIAMPLVVGGLAGLSVATACGAEPRVPRIPPAELARQTLESMAEKLPRELVENDLLTKIARSWASLIPADRLGFAIEDNAARLAFLLLSSGICSVLLAVASLSPIGFVLGLVAPFGVGAARDTFDRRREQHDVEEAMPEAFTALSMSLASGHSLAQGMPLWAPMRKNRCIPSFCGWRRQSIAASRRPTHSMTYSFASMPPAFRLSPWRSKYRSVPGLHLLACCPRRRAWWVSALSSNAVWTLRRHRRVCRHTWSRRCRRACARCWLCFRQTFAAVLRRRLVRAPWCWGLPSTSLPW